MADVRVIPLHRAERELVRAKLLEAVERGEDTDGMLNDVAEMLMKALRPHEVEALRDS